MTRRIEADDFEWFGASDEQDLEGSYGDLVPGLELDQAQVAGLDDLPDDVFFNDFPVEGVDAPKDMRRMADQFDISDLLDEGSSHNGALIDLDWLDPTQEQDPSRLPRQNHDMADELEAYWDNLKPRMAMELIPGTRDREAAVHERSLEGYDAPQNPFNVKVARRQVMSVLRQAIRRSTYGEDFKTLQAITARALGRDVESVRPVFAHIAEDHGLAGKVFIRASAFPGIEKGRFTDEIKRYASGARYLIVPATGHPLSKEASFGGMEVVQEVPWKQAYLTYKPLLEGRGYKVPAQGPYRERLKQAYAAGPDRQKPTSMDRAVAPPRLDDGITLRQAQKVLKANPVVRKVLSPRLKEAEDQKKRAVDQMRVWVKAGLLEKKDAFEIAQIGGEPHHMVQAAAQIIRASGKRAQYAGSGLGLNAPLPNLTRAQALKALRQASKEVLKREAALKQAQVGKLDKALGALVKRGQLIEGERSKLMSLIGHEGKGAADVWRIATALINDVARKHALPKQAKARDFEGDRFTPLVSEPKATRALTAFEKAGQAHGVKPAHIRGVVKWARIKMTEGAAGQELDHLVRHRFGKALREASDPFVLEARDAHEGLAGHVYVDAGAYASPKGVKGCDEGALQHRGNPLKYVLAMDRCASCALNVEGRCQKYAKILVDAAPVEDAVAYQVEAIRYANAPDDVVTRALFTPKYDPSEYGLDNDALDDLDLVENSEEPEDLGDVLWGGLVID